MTVEYHPAASKELNEAAKYYEEKSTGLGHEFLQEFDSFARRICEMPTRWMIVEDDVWRALMSGFLFASSFAHSMIGFALPW